MQMWAELDLLWGAVQYYSSDSCAAEFIRGKFMAVGLCLMSPWPDLLCFPNKTESLHCLMHSHALCRVWHKCYAIEE